jgi:hypothetical protein
VPSEATETRVVVPAVGALRALARVGDISRLATIRTEIVKVMERFM